MSSNYIKIIALTWMVESCITVPKPETPKLPAIASDIFSVCGPSDGAYAVQTFLDDQFQGQAELEWLAKAKSHWDIEISNAAGQRLLKIKNRNQHLEAQASRFKSLPSLEIDAAGFLLIDQAMIGLKVWEIPCVLAGKIPVTWQEGLEAFTLKDGSISMEFSDEFRSMEVQAQKITAPRESEICALVRWTHHVLLSESMTWCYRGFPTQKLDITGPKNLRMKMTTLSPRASH